MTTPAAASDLQSLRPLAGRSLVVMRPREQAESLCARIEAAGGHALRFPVIAVGPALDPAPLQAIVGRLDEFDLAFFVSPNAVDHAMRAILPQRAWPARLRVATVGKGSQRVMHGWGFAEVIAPQDGFDSEAVIALPEFAAEAVRGRKVLIFRGDGGRELLADTLRERGAAGFQAALPLASIVARRAASVSSDTRRSMVRFGISMRMRSPASTRPMAPPSAASGEAWPMDRPEVPPEKRPSVSSAQDLPSPFDFR